MTATAITAPAEINEIVANILATFPGLEMRWDGKVESTPPPSDENWARTTVRHATGEQGSLASDTGKRVWTRTGTLTVQVFAALSKGGLDVARVIAQALQDGVQGVSSSGCVWFRNATVNEIGVDKSWYNVNFTAFFTYDDVL
jgi:hypothetical protein